MRAPEQDEGRDQKARLDNRDGVARTHDGRPRTDVPHPPGSGGHTLGALLVRAAATATEHDGVRILDRKEHATWLPWAEILARGLQAGATLRRWGVQPGARVALVLPTSTAYFDAFFGCICAGAVPVPLYPPVRLGRLDEYFARTAEMLRRSEAVVVLADRRVRRVLGRVLDLHRPPLGIKPTEELRAGPPLDAPHDTSPDALAMVQFSSGTTVAPKPVGLTHAQVIANTEAIIDHMPPDAPWRHAGVSWLPLYHDMGLIGCIFPALHRPGPITLLPPEVFLIQPALWLRAISRYQGTVSPAPNFAYALCAQRIRDEELDGCDLSSWRIAMNGAEPVAPATLRTFVERFARWGLRPEALSPVYGLSEAALAVTFSDFTKPFATLRLDRGAMSQGRAVPGSAADAVELAPVGTPLRGFAVEIRADDGAVRAPGEIGAVWVAGPSLMKGYLDRADQPIVDGWLDTGDVGFVRDGQLFISGRAKDIIILRGKNHAPHDLEQAVDAVPGVRTGCAVAVGEVAEDGERLLVFVEWRDDTVPTEDLAESCRQAVRSASGLDPALVVVVAPGTLPRTSSGKLRRAETLRRWQDGSLTPPEQVTPWLLAGALARSALGLLKGR